MRTHNDAATTLTVGIGIWLFFIVGWIINIVTFVTGFTTLGGLTGFQIMQVISIFLGPVGSIMGYISLF
ncbi:hypothetical protein [Synechococcus phage BUCT-ZZ01]|nr:hypothetical protein [Synechococcus phage BUCT-ZZ01]